MGTYKFFRVVYNFYLCSEVTRRTRDCLAPTLEELHRVSTDWKTEKVMQSYVAFSLNPPSGPIQSMSRNVVFHILDYFYFIYFSVSVLQSEPVERFSVSRMRDF